MFDKDFYLTIINNLQDGVYFVDTERRILFWNKAAEKITGYSAEEMLGRPCAQSRLNHIDEDGRPLCIVGCPLFSTIVDGRQRRETVFLRHKEGYRISVIVNIFPIYKDGEITGAVEIFTRNSPTVYEGDLVDRLSTIATHDPLTHLPNRRYLESFLRYRFDEYNRFGRLCAVLFSDIDNFSRFNNEYGHDIGDKVLSNIAASIQRNVRRDDLVGRWGGEEFVGVYSIAKPEDAAIVAEKYRQMVLNTEVPYKDGVLNVTMSIGITVIRPDDTMESVVERADQLMYQAKKAGKNRAIVG